LNQIHISKLGFVQVNKQSWAFVHQCSWGLPWKSVPETLKSNLEKGAFDYQCPVKSVGQGEWAGAKVETGNPGQLYIRPELNPEHAAKNENPKLLARILAYCFNSKFIFCTINGGFD